MFSQKTLPDISMQTTELVKNIFCGIPYQAWLKSTSQSYMAYAFALVTSKNWKYLQFLQCNGNVVLTNNNNNNNNKNPPNLRIRFKIQIDVYGIGG